MKRRPHEVKKKSSTLTILSGGPDSERNSMITRGLDYHSHNTRSKETIRSIRSNTKWGLLRSFNSALTVDWNSLPEDMRCLPFDAFKISILKNFKSQ